MGINMSSVLEAKNYKGKVGTIVTYSGRSVTPLDPKPEQIFAEDFAHALSNLCRFTGHVSKFYSVAEHLCRCHDYADEEFKLWALLHDAPEAYLNDIARPLKVTDAYETYRIAEDSLMEIIAKKYGLEWPEPPEVKVVDNTLLQTEMRDLMPPACYKISKLGIDPLKIKISPWLPSKAKREFIGRLRQHGIVVK